MKTFKKSISTLVLGFLVFCCHLATGQVNDKDLTGVYLLGRKSEAEPLKPDMPRGKIQVIQLSATTVFIKLTYTSGVAGNNSGAIADTARIQNRKAVLTTKEDPSCVLVFDFQPTGIAVMQRSNAGAFQCGFGRNVDVEGFYQKTTNKGLGALRTGQHNLTLQWISWEKPGKASLSMLENGVYQINGRQADKENKDTVSIKGKLYALSDKELLFYGSITTQISYINKGKPCLRQGMFFFKAPPNKKYWRLQQMINCEGGTVTDYLDIYF